MKSAYYKLPLVFKDLITRKEAAQTTLEQSVAQCINLVATTAFGECKFDETYGCKIWETDFDMLTADTTVKENVKKYLRKAIAFHEKRLTIIDIQVDVRQEKIPSPLAKLVVKKKVEIVLNGIIIKTNKPFSFRGYFYIGPLSC